MDADSSQDFERLRSTMVSLISHELRTPLTYISASLEMLEIAYENPELQKEVKRFLQIIDQGVKQLGSSIDELLSFSSLEREAHQPALAPHTRQELDLRELVLGVVNVLKPSYTSKRQVLEVAIADDLPALYLDGGKMAEIVLQLLSNAIKFTPPEGHLRLLLRQEDPQWLQLIVSDTGPGIPPELEAQIFDPFYQREDHLIRENGGLGLGLTLVQRLCQAIGARLEIFPESGHYTGTNFVVRLPVSQAGSDSPELQKALEQMRNLSDSNAEKEAMLSKLKAQLLKHTEELQQAFRSNQQKQHALDTIYPNILSGFAAALELRDPYTRGRSQRLVRYAEVLGEALALDADAARQLEQACLLCDIGYIGISDEVLHKSDSESLSEAERQHIQSHARIGAEMLQHVKLLEPIVPLVLHHHENWDGSGYPSGLKGQDIPYLSRVVRVIDAFEAMLSDRSYRPRLAPKKALDEICLHAGSQFDPEIVKLFTGLWHSGKLSALIPSLAHPVPPAGQHTKKGEEHHA